MAVANTGVMSCLLSYWGGRGGKNKKRGMAFVKIILDLQDLRSAANVV